MKRFTFLFAAFSLLGVAAPINVGLLSLDAAGPGSVAVSVTNLTETFALDPDFPVANALTFLGSTATLVLDSGSQIVLLGDLGPGGWSTAPFADSLMVVRVVFNAILSPTAFALLDGSNVAVAGSDLSATLNPSMGRYLVVGDFALIAAPDAVPEPASAALCLMGAVSLAALKTRNWLRGINPVRPS